jgi:hypothetical protein
VNLTKIGFKDEPFVAKNVLQVFYVKDMTSKTKNKNPKEHKSQSDKLLF